MHLKLYIESSISVVLAFRARLVQLNRSDQRSHRSTLGSQNTIPSAGCWNIISVVMPRARRCHPRWQQHRPAEGWLCCHQGRSTRGGSDVLGTACGFNSSHIHKPCCSSTFVSFYPLLPRWDQKVWVCRALETRLQAGRHSACLHCTVQPRRSWSWAVWDTMS